MGEAAVPDHVIRPVVCGLAQPWKGIRTGVALHGSGVFSASKLRDCLRFSSRVTQNSFCITLLRPRADFMLL
jgi:hypothetical protein